MPRARSTCSINTPQPCGKIAVRLGRCDDHATEYEQARGSRQARGYGKAHTDGRARLLRERRALLRRGVVDPAAPLLICPRCGRSIATVPDSMLDADHVGTVPPAAPDRLSHRGCNRAEPRLRAAQEPPAGPGT